jgi:hypothetical protein
VNLASDLNAVCIGVLFALSLNMTVGTGIRTLLNRRSLQRSPAA